jgi:hypothetical protein
VSTKYDNNLNFPFLFTTSIILMTALKTYIFLKDIRTYEIRD